MEIGETIRIRRHELSMDLRNLEEKSGINHGTISRLENGKVNIFVKTAIQLLSALKVDPVKVFYPNIKNSIGISLSIPPSEKYLNSSDIQSFFQVFQKRPLSTLDNLIGITEMLLSQNNKWVQIRDEYKGRRSSGNTPTQLSDICELLANMGYPSDIDNVFLLNIMNSGSAISLLDFGYFLKNARKGLSLSLIDVQEKSGISDSTLSNLENAKYQQVKISDIIILDRILKTKGVLLQFIWNVFEFTDNGFSIISSSQERDIFHFLLCV